MPAAARRRATSRHVAPRRLAKAPTGIDGFDEIDRRRLSARAADAVCGGPGAARRSSAWSSSSRAASSAASRASSSPSRRRTRISPRTSASLGFDLDDLIRRKTARRRYMSASSGARSRRPASTTSKGCSSGSDHAIDRSAPSASCSTRSSRSSRASPTPAILRAELRRLFALAQGHGITAVITGERGDGHADAAGARGVRLRLRDPARPPVDRPGFDAPAARREIPRLRHGTNEYPFLIDERGIARAADHLAAAGSHRPAPSGSPPAWPGSTRCSAARATTAAAASCLRQRRHRQDEPRRALRRMPPAAAASARSASVRGVAGAVSSATCARSAWTWTAG